MARESFNIVWVAERVWSHLNRANAKSDLGVPTALLTKLVRSAAGQLARSGNSVSVYSRFGVMVLVIGFTSCSSSGPVLPPKKPVVPVSGVVRVDGQPQEGIIVTLQPTTAKHGLYQFPTAITNGDGSFELSTYAENDGAPEGEYRALFSWPLQEDEEDLETDKLKRLYSSHDALGQNPKFVVKIGHEPMELDPFELKLTGMQPKKLTKEELKELKMTRRQRSAVGDK